VLVDKIPPSERFPTTSMRIAGTDMVGNQRSGTAEVAAFHRGGPASVQEKKDRDAINELRR
jgi:hypothetical protein